MWASLSNHTMVLLLGVKTESFRVFVYSTQKIQ